MNNPYGYPYQQSPYPRQDFRDAKGICLQLIHYHVIGQLTDGTQTQGIIEDADDEGVTMLVPEDVEAPETPEDRTYGFGGYGGGYNGYGGGGYGRRRYRRFRRRRFPFTAFVFPFFIPFPYYY